MATLKKGDRVQVFQMWTTREEPEGIAELVKWIGREQGVPGADRWWVHFDDDGDDDSAYQRTVWNKDKAA